MDKKGQDPPVTFIHDPLQPHVKKTKSPWKVLIVDDEKAIHDITERVLSDFTFRKNHLAFLHAFSGKEATLLLEKNPDTALVLLDVILESETAGLDFIRHARKTLGNTITQMVIRTGRPETAPEQRVIEAYEINDYRMKSELTAQKLYAVVTASLGSFDAKSRLKNELEKRRKSEARFRDIAQSMGDWIWEVDPEGLYTYNSHGSEHLSGYRLEELLGKEFTFLFTEKSKNGPFQAIHQCMASGSSFENIEIWIRNRENTRKCLLTSGTPIRSKKDKALLGYRGVHKDITRLKRSEGEKKKLVSQLRQSQRLEAIGTLAGGIAHDFNNILGAILGYTQLLQMDISKDQKADHYINQILKGCNRAKNLIVQLLDFSRLNRRNSSSQAPGISSSTIIKEIVKLLQPTTPSFITIKPEISEECEKIAAEPALIQQAVMNLCTNAVKAIQGSSGTITIRSQQVRFSEEKQDTLPSPDLDFGNYVAISVMDDGIGMEPDTMERIFDPYFSTRLSGEKSSEGTGLGLSVVHGIAAECRGTVVVKSEPGKGTECTLYFPSCTTKGEETTMENTSPPASGEGKVLFVDDEQMLIDLGKTILDRLGYCTTALQSPLDALDRIENDPFAFDIVITDMTMPELQGTDLASRIKKIRPDLPVVLVTGVGNLEESTEANSMDIDAVLPKPISMHTLSQTLQKLLSP
ncbi:MAG: response regulator [Desulfobacteraceae bacterium]